MAHRVVAFALLLLTVVQIAFGQDFGYDGEMGPSHWGEQYNTCTGKHQSPININSLTVKRTVLPPLVMTGFDTVPDKTNISNNGHTVMYKLDAEVQPTISGGPLNGVYEFAQLHFHWGDNDTLGSEDTIDGVSYPLELHMVFYKKMYRNQRDALQHSDGLTVLAFFYELREQPNHNYVGLTGVLDNITESGESQSFQDEAPTLRHLLSDDLVHYFTYNGSLTTPPCSEVVTWLDFKKPIPLSHDQLEKFRALRDGHGQQLTHNFRPIQDLGDRVVLFNIEDPSDNTLEAEAHNSNNNDDDDQIPPEVLDPSTMYNIDPTEKPVEDDDHDDEDNDDDADVGIGSIHENMPADSNDLQATDDAPEPERRHAAHAQTADNADDIDRQANPKLKALQRGKESGAAQSARQLAAAVCIGMAAVAVFWH